MTKITDSPFDLHHHGDEIILSLDKAGNVKADYKQQTDIDSYRHLKLTAPSYTQMYELLKCMTRSDRRK